MTGGNNGNGGSAIKGRISFRQIVIVFFITSIASITSILPLYLSETAKQASWLSPIVSMIPMLFLIFILDVMTKKHREKSYAEIIEMVLGKAAGKLFLFLMLAFIIFFIAGYTRHFSEKIISTVFFDTKPEFFIISVLFVSYLISRRNIQSFVRFCELIFAVIIFTFAIFIFLGIFKVKSENLYPVTTYDIVPLAKSMFPTMSILSLFSFTLFLNDNSSNMSSFTNISIKYSVILTAFSTFIFINITGIFGAATVQNIYLPFYSIFKRINMLGITQSIETFYIILWIFTDIILVTYFLFIVKNISKTLFVLENPKSIITPFCFIIYILSLLIASNRFEIDLFDRYFVSAASVCTGFIFPVIIVIVGKIRKLL